jgi:hypothetical protein
LVQVAQAVVLTQMDQTVLILSLTQLHLLVVAVVVVQQAMAETLA